MRSLIGPLVCAAAALSCPSVFAQQLPADAPAGSTVQCKDGSFESAESKKGACSGHKGIKTWYGKAAGRTGKADRAEMSGGAEAASKQTDKPSAKATTAAPTAKTQSADVGKTASGPTTAGKTPAREDSNKTAAAGGGAGKVWVNEDSNVYHCMGDRYYGKTKKGEYMSESDATARGARPANKKSCAAS